MTFVILECAVINLALRFSLTIQLVASHVSVLIYGRKWRSRRSDEHPWYLLLIRLLAR